MVAGGLLSTGLGDDAAIGTIGTDSDGEGWYARMADFWRGWGRLVVITGLVTIALVAAREVLDTQHIFQSDVDAMTGYVGTIGALYSILAAFIIFVVWTRYNDTTRAIADEARDLADLYRYVTYLNDPRAQAQFRRAIEGYVAAVSEDEWSAMAAGRTSQRAVDAFEEIFLAISGVRFDDERDEGAWNMIIQKFEGISDSRSSRLELAQQRIPRLLSVLLWSVSLATVAGFFFLGIQNNFLAWTSTLLTTAIIVLVIDTVADMDNPFYGQWQISTEPYQDVPAALARIDAVLARATTRSTALR